MPKQFIITKILANIHQFFIFCRLRLCQGDGSYYGIVKSTNKSNRNKKKPYLPHNYNNKKYQWKISSIIKKYVIHKQECQPEKHIHIYMFCYLYMFFFMLVEQQQNCVFYFLFNIFQLEFFFYVIYVAMFSCCIVTVF